MIKLGQRQQLKIYKFAKEGTYLYDGIDPNRLVLLEEKLAQTAKKEDQLWVFPYKDKGQIKASTKKPYLEVDQIGLLKVVSKTKIGAFMDIGIEKDVLLPFAEMLGQIHDRQPYLVRMYLDKSERLALTMKIRDYLRTDSPYQKGDLVSGVIYSSHKDHGLFVAVDEKYDSLVPKDQVKGIYQVGEVITAEVIFKNKDGKLVLSFDNQAHYQIDQDSEMILDLLEDNGGSLEIGDKSKAEEIKKITGLSKTNFKRAIGKLYKERQIKIFPEKISLN
ncbi:MAG: S1-like domain-containing RNA-binding protein [Bacillota bacterium]|nr:S1-like domain-containing RNA-binding protein [Bacillota bacterium]